jgi:hypothetical protein
MLYRFTVLIEAIWQYTYFISLPVGSLQWCRFKSRHWSIGGFVSFVRSLLDFKRVAYYKYVCIFIDKSE